MARDQNRGYFSVCMSCDDSDGDKLPPRRNKYDAKEAHNGYEVFS